jgi:pyruvate,water dikinase
MNTRPLLVTGPGAAELPPMSGAKAANLRRLSLHGFNVPPTLFLPPGAYGAFVRHSGLATRIDALTGSLRDGMRWEEIWDVSLKLRNFFLRQSVPPELAEAVLVAVKTRLPAGPLAVRSCSPEEDSGFSHAGMHDSVLEVRGDQELLRAVRAVWASLWTDRAILYRREMGLDAGTSDMGILIQPMVAGRVSGVLFTASPMDESAAVIEAAPGLARDVVEDRAGAERIVMSRSGATEVSRTGPREHVLGRAEAREILELGLRIEKLFGSPQDIEWTLAETGPVILQARPVTTLARTADAAGWGGRDKRPWYLSLTRSHRNLVELRDRIEGQILPGMLSDSERLKGVDLLAMGPEEIEVEVRRRREALERWRDTYWRELIPFAHAVRQFGMLYNDAVTPEDPFEFTALLTGQDLLAVRRNDLLAEMADIVRADPALAAGLEAGDIPATGPFAHKLEEFVTHFGDLSCGTSWCEEGPLGIVRLTLELSRREPVERKHAPAADLEARFLTALTPEKREFGSAVLALARTSYRLRDDDNLYLGKIQARHDEALAHALALGLKPDHAAIEGRASLPKGNAWAEGDGPSATGTRLKGWAAAAGLARGRARVVTEPEGLFSFRSGEILVCDALDPNMTFVAPLAAGIVERRGGMLVHGAIIAREYGIPCVTGIDDATARIRDGQTVLVDGFRGEVLVDPQA